MTSQAHAELHCDEGALGWSDTRCGDHNGLPSPPDRDSELQTKGAQHQQTTLAVAFWPRFEDGGPRGAVTMQLDVGER